MLLTEDAPIARQVLHKLVVDENTNPRIRIDAAKILLDRAGITPPAKADAAAAERPINELTADELVGFIGQREAEVARLAAELNARAERAKRVDSAPNSDPAPLELADMLD